MVFIILKILRKIFVKKRIRLLILAKCLSEVLKSWLKERNKKCKGKMIINHIYYKKHVNMLQVNRPISTHRGDGPSQVGMWDITWLPSAVKRLYYYLYLILTSSHCSDIYEIYDVNS